MSHEGEILGCEDGRILEQGPWRWWHLYLKYTEAS